MKLSKQAFDEMNKIGEITMTRIPRGNWGELLGFDELQWHIKNVLIFTRMNRWLANNEL